MLSLAIQAGGGSRRMGQDKALLDFDGQPLILRIVRRLTPLADEIFVTTDRRAGYESLGIPLISDILAGRGALGGLYTALKAARHPLVAIVACDMPFVSAELLAYQRDLLNAGSFDAVMPCSSAGFEPFHSIYRKSSFIPIVETALEAGLWRVEDAFSRANVRFLTPSEIECYDPSGLTFTNVNTPKDLELALRHISAPPSK
mgnify:CR=1 FL=1